MPYSSQTPGGVAGNINNSRYGYVTRPGAAQNSSSMQSRAAAAGGGGYHGGGGYGGGYRPSMDGFQRYEDQAYDAAQARFNPVFAQQQRQMEQRLINQGIDPTSEAGRQALDDLSRRHESARQQAIFGAQQQGLSAQNQFAQQNLTQDQIQAQLAAAGMAASASRFGSSASANASMYGTDAQRYLGELGHALGVMNLNEGARQFDVNDVFRSGNQDLQLLQSLFGMGMGMDQSGRAAFDQNQGYGNQWWNQVGSMLGQATGGYFTPVDVVGSANAQTQAGAGRDQFTVGMMRLLGGA